MDKIFMWGAIGMAFLIGFIVGMALIRYMYYKSDKPSL